MDQSAMITANRIIEMFDMKPLEAEGGYYVETYRAAENIAQDALPDRYDGGRPFASAILYLLTPDTFSTLHRLKSDEIFHFYLGDPVTMLQLHPDGSHEVITLGQDITAGQKLQAIVPRRTWQGCCLKDSDKTPPVTSQSQLFLERPNKPGRFALMGTTVTPAFDFKDFETADRKTLLKKYPNQKNLILRLTTDPNKPRP